MCLYNADIQIAVGIIGRQNRCVMFFLLSSRSNIHFKCRGVGVKTNDCIV